jgi:HK97 family phage major capsid protein
MPAPTATGAPAPKPDPVISRLMAGRDAVLAEGEALLARAAEENRDLTDEEETQLTDIKADAEKRNVNITRLEEWAVEKDKAAEARSKYDEILVPEEKRPEIRAGRQEMPYREHGEYSFFRDIYGAKNGDLPAMERLHRHNLFMQKLRPEYSEERAGTSGSATSFGSFIPPIWLLDEIALLARTGRVVPNLCRDAGEPQSTSITIPRVTTGTATAIQATENTTVGTTDVITAQLTRTTSTIGGYQDVSVQSVELSPMAIDRFIFGDLIADYNRAVDSQCIIGTGANNQLLGLDTLTGVNAVTYTDATPTVPELYSNIANAVQQVHTGRFAPPDAILMHPRRWGWLLAASDSTGRPLVTPYAPYNNPGQMNGIPSFGPVGSLQGLPVYTDANIPTTVGAGTEDEIYVARFADMLFMEGPLRSEVFRDIGSANATVRFRVYAFCNLFVGRFPAGVSRIKGTGLIAPVF